MNFSDYETLFYASSLFSQNRRAPDRVDEMHCCENCKRYEFNEGTYRGCTDDPIDDNDCDGFSPQWVLK